MLLTYYAFLATGVVLSLVFYRTPSTKGPRRAFISFLLVPPLMLATSVSNFNFVGILLLSVAVILVATSSLKRYADAPVTRETLYYSFGLLLIEAALPAAIRFGLRLPPDAERWPFLIAAFAIWSATILLFGVWAPDVHRKA